MVDLARHHDHREDDPGRDPSAGGVLTRGSAVALEDTGRPGAERSEASAASTPAVARLALLVVAAGISAFAVWLVSPRFGIDGPSFVDDWAAITRSPDQVSELLRLSSPEPERFRPGWILWNYLQWHTFDGPQGLVGPNLWNVARVLVLVIGLTLMTWLLLPRPTGRRDAVIAAGLAGLPAFLVFTVPKFARDVAWFGPQEPMLIGALALGGALLALAARALLAEAPVARPRVVALAIAGSAFWALGAYHKESSVSAVPLLAAVLFVARDRRKRWPSLSTGRKRALVALGAVVVVPLLHVSVQIVRIASRGDLVYGAEVDAGAGIVRGLEILWDWSSEALPLTARQLMAGAVVLTIVAALVRRRLDVVVLGALASGALTIVFAAQSGVAVSRYYMPAYAMFAVAFVVSLARFPAIVRAAGLLLVFFAFVPPYEAHDEVRLWSDEEQQGAQLVDRVAELHSSGCVVAADGLDLETGIALPVLVGLEQDVPRRTCAPGAVYLVLPPSFEGVPLAGVCPAGSLEPLVLGRLANLYACPGLADAPVRDPEAGLVSPEDLVTLRRFRPAV